MSTTGKWITGLIALVIVITLVTVFGRGENGGEMADEGPIRIGYMAPMSGDLGNVGLNARAAVELAVEEVNAAGGIDGRSLEVVYEDDKCSGPTAVSIANKLVSTDKVVAVAGPLCSPAVLSAAPVFEAARIPALSFCATAPKVSDAGDYIFRNVPSDNFQAKFAAEYIYNKMGKKKAAVMAVNNDWGLGVSGAFKDAFAILGGEIVFSETYASDTRDLRSQLSKVKATDADVLYFAGFPDGSTIAIKQMQELGLSLPTFGADAWDDTKIWADVGPAGEGMMFTAAATNATEEFKAGMLAKTGGDEIIYCSNYAYDGVKMLAQIMNEVGADPEMIKSRLYTIRHEGEVSQPITEFDVNGDPKASVYALKVVRDGKPEVMGE